MSLTNKLLGGIDKLRGYSSDISKYAHDGSAPETLSNGLERIFWENDGPLVHKWLHYLPIYERHFQRYRDTPVKFLEIGVSKGGSLKMWRDYLGADAKIFGIDIDPDCAKYDGLSGQVRIGSQADAGFLSSVVDEMGGIDVVLDDGSHDSHHIRQSLHALYPRLEDGGTYMIEDLHCAYWPKWSGGYRRSSSFMNDIKQMVDDMHHWYHGRPQRDRATAGQIGAMHIYDSIVVLDKEVVRPPSHHMVGG